MKTGSKRYYKSSGGISYILPGLVAATKSKPSYCFWFFTPFLIIGVLAATIKSFVVDVIKGNGGAWR